MELSAPNPVNGLPPGSAEEAFSLKSKIARTPYFAWISSTALLLAVPAAVRNPSIYPHLVQLPLFATIFGGSGYMFQAGDSRNGAGTTTAWSLTYLFLHAKKSIVSKKPGPLVLTSIIASSAALYGSEYFGNED